MRLIAACENNECLRTFLLVMRYSGLATVDVVRLTPDRLEGNHLRLRRMKTKGWVKVLLPGVVADQLRELPVQAGGYWFWNRKAESRHETATGNMRRQLRPVFGPNGANIALRDEDGTPILNRQGKQKLPWLENTEPGTFPRSRCYQTSNTMRIAADPLFGCKVRTSASVT